MDAGEYAESSSDTPNASAATWRRLGRVDDPSADRYEAALRRLPEAYAVALRLRDAGTPDNGICDRLGIEPEGLETLMVVADRKLAAELGRGSSDG